MSKDNIAVPLVPTSKPVLLNLQNGMPVITQTRSRELDYDILEGNLRFVRNPYGPQWLAHSRNAYKWT